MEVLPFVCREVCEVDRGGRIGLTWALTSSAHVFCRIGKSISFCRVHFQAKASAANAPDAVSLHHAGATHPAVEAEPWHVCLTSKERSNLNEIQNAFQWFGISLNCCMFPMAVSLHTACGCISMY